MKKSDDLDIGIDIDINYVRHRKEQYKINGFKTLDKDLLKAINTDIVSAVDKGYTAVSFCLTYNKYFDDEGMKEICPKDKYRLLVAYYKSKGFDVKLTNKPDDRYDNARPPKVYYINIAFND